MAGQRVVRHPVTLLREELPEQSSEPGHPTQGFPGLSCTVLVPVPLLRWQLWQSRTIREIPASGMQMNSFYPI